MHSKKAVPSIQLTISNSKKLENFLQAYYGKAWIRMAMNFIYIINEILLALYLLFIPIQIAYYWLLSNGENAKIQTGIDITVLVLFIVHILLYLDEKFFQIMKNPYAIIWKKIVTVELIYDFFCVILAIYAVAAVKKSIGERIVEIIFVFKIYKLVKFDRKAMYFVIGTNSYIVYKVVRTLLIVFMAIAFVGSLFYGVAYILYAHDIDREMLWIVSCPAISECVERPFIIQLEYAMYWAIGTASTAAYGDISATQPTVVVVNLLALAFQGFLFGFYLNSMHSIPLENQKKQSDLLQKFDSFQQHSSNRKLDNKLYLQILCSLEYTQSQKRSLESIERVMPKRYVQQIKYNIYSQFLDKKEYFSFEKNGGFDVGLKDNILIPMHQSNPHQSRQKELLFNISDIVTETICEIHQNIYDYKNVDYSHILFVKEGSVNFTIAMDKEHPSGISDTHCYPGDCFGSYSFFTDLQIPSKAICTSYSIIFSIERAKFKQLLLKDEKMEFYKRFKRSILFEEPLLNREPIMKFIQSIQMNNCQTIQTNFDKRFSKYHRLFSQKKDHREKYRRENIKTKKVIQHLPSNKRNQETQTQVLFEDDLINFIDVYDLVYDESRQDEQFEKAESIGKISQRSRDKRGYKQMEAFMIQMM